MINLFKNISYYIEDYSGKSRYYYEKIYHDNSKLFVIHNKLYYSAGKKNDVELMCDGIRQKLVGANFTTILLTVDGEIIVPSKDKILDIGATKIDVSNWYQSEDYLLAFAENKMYLWNFKNDYIFKIEKKGLITDCIMYFDIIEYLMDGDLHLMYIDGIYTYDYKVHLDGIQLLRFNEDKYNLITDKGFIIHRIRKYDTHINIGRPPKKVVEYRGVFFILDNNDLYTVKFFDDDKYEVIYIDYPHPIYDITVHYKCLYAYDERGLVYFDFPEGKDSLTIESIISCIDNRNYIYQHVQVD